jgi:hypothetical protein
LFFFLKNVGWRARTSSKKEKKEKVKKVLTKGWKRDIIYLADAQKVSTENLDN